MYTFAPIKPLNRNNYEEDYAGRNGPCRTLCLQQ